MIRKPLFILLIILLVGVGASAQDATPTPDPNLPTLRIGVLPVLNTIPLFVAQEQGFYVEEGVNVELIPFQSADQQGQAIEAGELDGVNTDMVRVISRAASDAEVKLIVIRHDAPMGAPYFAVVANKDSGIANVEDLVAALEAGETQIAISTNSIIEYLTTQMLRSADYEPTDSTYTEVPAIPVRLELLNAGTVTTATLPEPLVTFTTTIQGNITVIADAEVTDFIPTVLAVDRNLTEENPEALAAFLRAYERAVTLINDNPNDFRDTPIQVPDPVRATYTVPQFVTARVPSEEETAAVVDWMVERGYLEEAIAYEELVDGSFLPEVEPSPEATESAGG